MKTLVCLVAACLAGSVLCVPQFTGKFALCGTNTIFPIGQDPCVSEEICNNGTSAISYSFIGVKVTGPSPSTYNYFQTLDGGSLSVGPNCCGPVGTCGGAQSDSIRGDPGQNKPHIDVAGNYSFSMGVCYSDWDTCRGASGDWQWYTPIDVTFQSS